MSKLRPLPNILNRT